jgi:hypothetical protein
VLVGRGQQSNLNALQERRTHRFTGEDGGDTPVAEQVAFRSKGNVAVPGAARVHADGRTGTGMGRVNVAESQRA